MKRKKINETAKDTGLSGREKENQNKKDSENTNDEVSKKENVKKPRSIKMRLENNKIFLEAFSYLFVGIMGILISFFGWQTNKRSADIYQKQLEVLENDREPYFSLTQEAIREERDENGYNIYYKYTIKNEGGIIYNAYLSMPKACMVIYAENDECIYKYYLDGKFSIPNDKYIYDMGTKKFSFNGQDNSEFSNFIEELEKHLVFLFDNPDITISTKNYVRISYVNYKNEKRDKVYEFSKDSIFTTTEDNVEKEIILGESRIEESENLFELAFDIHKSIEEIREE